MHCYKNARVILPTDRSLTVPRAFHAKHHRAICTRQPSPPTQSSAPCRQRVRVTGGLCRRAQHRSFLRADQFAIPARGSDAGGRWQRACRKATSHWVSRRAAAYSAHSSWSARCVAAHDISLTCEPAGSADFTHSGPIVIGPIACIGILTVSCVSSGMNSGTAGPLHFISLAHRNCAASRRYCPGTALTRLCPARSEFCCAEPAGAPDRRYAWQAVLSRLVQALLVVRGEVS